MTLISPEPLIGMFAGLLSAVVVLAVLVRFAPVLRLVATPNYRSSHVSPTPTGGGIAMVFPVLAWCASAPVSWGVSLACAAGVLALVGLLDDVFELPAIPRLLIQAGSVMWMLAQISPEPGIIVFLVTALAVLWFVNLFNFMDGIDGIAGSQVVVFGVGVLLLSGATLTWVESLIWVLIGSSVGFLLFNWHPARIFMGDAGSLSVGLCLPVIALVLDHSGEVPLVASLILLAAFVFDASYTLGVRILTGQQFASAHRSHLYQRLADAWGHGRTTAAFLGYSALLLLPAALLASRYPNWGIVLLAVVVAPLAVLSWRYRAGMPSVTRTYENDE